MESVAAIMKELEQIGKQLDLYNGRVMMSLSNMDADVLFWNEKTKKIEVLYSP